MALDPEQWITLVLSKANELRKAGVRSLNCELYTATFDPLPPEIDQKPIPLRETTDRYPVDPFKDRFAYPGLEVPQRDDARDDDIDHEPDWGSAGGNY